MGNNLVCSKCLNKDDETTEIRSNIKTKKKLNISQRLSEGEDRVPPMQLTTSETERSRTSRTRADVSLPKSYYKTITDTSLKSVKASQDEDVEIATRDEKYGENTQSQLVSDLTQTIKDKVDITEKQSTPVAKEEDNSCKKPQVFAHKRNYYDPGQEADIGVNFNPSKIAKKTNVNDVNKINAEHAIRQYKDLENRFIDLEVNRVIGKLSYKKIDVKYDNNVVYGMESKQINEKNQKKKKTNLNKRREKPAANSLEYDSDLEVDLYEPKSSQNKHKKTSSSKTKYAYAAKKQDVTKENDPNTSFSTNRLSIPVDALDENVDALDKSIDDSEYNIKGDIDNLKDSEEGKKNKKVKDMKKTKEKVDQVTFTSLTKKKRDKTMSSDIERTNRDEFLISDANQKSASPTIDPKSCNDCEQVYKATILSNSELQMCECLACNNILNKESLEFYKNKYNKDAPKTKRQNGKSKSKNINPDSRKDIFENLKEDQISQKLPKSSIKDLINTLSVKSMKEFTRLTDSTLTGTTIKEYLNNVMLKDDLFINKALTERTSAKTNLDPLLSNILTSELSRIIRDDEEFNSILLPNKIVGKKGITSRQDSRVLTDKEVENFLRKLQENIIEKATETQKKENIELTNKPLLPNKNKNIDVVEELMKIQNRRMHFKDLKEEFESKKDFKNYIYEKFSDFIENPTSEGATLLTQLGFSNEQINFALSNTSSKEGSNKRKLNKLASNFSNNDGTEFLSKTSASNENTLGRRNYSHDMINTSKPGLGVKLPPLNIAGIHKMEEEFDTHGNEEKSLDNETDEHYSDAELERLNQLNSQRLRKIREFRQSQRDYELNNLDSDGTFVSEDKGERGKKLNNLEALDNLLESSFEDNKEEMEMKLVRYKAWKNNRNEVRNSDLVANTNFNSFEGSDEIGEGAKKDDADLIFPLPFSPEELQKIKEYQTWKLRNEEKKSALRKGKKQQRNIADRVHFSDDENQSNEEDRKRNIEFNLRKKDINRKIWSERENFKDLVPGAKNHSMSLDFNKVVEYNPYIRNLRAFGSKSRKDEGFVDFSRPFNGRDDLDQEFEMKRLKCANAYTERKKKKEALEMLENERKHKADLVEMQRAVQKERKKEEERLEMEKRKQFLELKKEELQYKKEKKKSEEIERLEEIKEKMRQQEEERKLENARKAMEYQKELEKKKEQQLKMESQKREEEEKKKHLLDLEKLKHEEELRLKEQKKEEEKQKLLQERLILRKKTMQLAEQREIEKMASEMKMKEEKERKENERKEKQLELQREKEKRETMRLENERKLNEEREKQLKVKLELEERKKEELERKKEEMKRLNEAKKVEEEKIREELKRQTEKLKEEEAKKLEAIRQQTQQMYAEKERKRQEDILKKKEEEEEKKRKEEAEVKRQEEEMIKLKKEEEERIERMRKQEEEEEQKKKEEQRLQEEEEIKRQVEEIKRKAEEEEAEQKRREEEIEKLRSAKSSDPSNLQVIDEEPENPDGLTPEERERQALARSRFEKLKEKEDVTASNGYQFEILYRESDKMDEEKEVVVTKKEILEQIGFTVDLRNLPASLKGEEFIIEILYSNTQNPRDFFTIGTSKVQKLTGDKICFPESFAVNFVFERMQFIRVIANVSTGLSVELTINLAKAVTNKLADITYPGDFLIGECLLFDGNKCDNKKSQIDIKFKRVTKDMEIPIPSLNVEFKYNSASTQANRLKYYLMAEEEKTGLIRHFHTSNELMGKSNLRFAIASFMNNDIFLNEKFCRYILEFYEGKNEYFGQAFLERSEINEMIKTKGYITISVYNDGKPYYSINKPKNLLGGWGTKKDADNIVAIVEKKTEESKTEPSQKESKGSSKELSWLKKKGSKDTVANAAPIKKVTAELKKPGWGGAANKAKAVVAKASVYYELRRRKKLFDYLYEGMTIAFDIAIDFTASNKDPSCPDSLHTYALENNLYCKAITGCGNVLKEYDSDQLFPVFGFGGIGPGGKAVSHCFNLNGKKDPNVKGIEGIIETYKECLKTVQLVGPTYFQHIIKQVIEIAKKSKPTDPLSYHVFMILTDGKIDDMDLTKELVVEAAKLSISVIIVGIGDADFTKMVALDGDVIPVTNPVTGEVIYRDNVQFVNFKELNNDGTLLAKKVLEQVPIQIEEFGRKKGL